MSPSSGQASTRSTAPGDREQFRTLLQEDSASSSRGTASPRTCADAKRIAAEIGFPVLVRPSFVLGGRAMEIVYDDAHLDRYMREAIDASSLSDTPILIDKFLNDADECDVDCIADYEPEEPPTEEIEDPEHGGTVKMSLGFMKNAVGLLKAFQTFSNPATADAAGFDRAFAAMGVNVAQHCSRFARSISRDRRDGTHRGGWHSLAATARASCRRTRSRTRTHRAAERADATSSRKR